MTVVRITRNKLSEFNWHMEIYSKVNKVALLTLLLNAVEGHDLVLCGVKSENFAMYLLSPYYVHLNIFPLSALTLPSLSVFLAPPSNFPSETHLYS